MESLIWIGFVASLMLACWWTHRPNAYLLSGGKVSGDWEIFCGEAGTSAVAVLKLDQDTHEPRISHCSLWPARRGCSRSCLQQVLSLAENSSA
jgi:hypothetical protein